MAVWFTGDTHFGHANILKYCNRPWAHVDQMDADLIRTWNFWVQKGDTVYHLGDFAFGNPYKYIASLNGTIHLIRGNHDNRWNDDLFQMVDQGLLASYGDVREIRHDGHRIFASHYSHQVWPARHHGALHVFGHSHGTLAGIGRSMDVGVDAVHGYAPISVKSVIDVLTKIEDREGVLRG